MEEAAELGADRALESLRLSVSIISGYSLTGRI